jgi:hypothetical protein
MHSSKELDLHDESVKITWCACEICSATGPRSMTLIRNHHEFTVDLNSHCCRVGLEGAILSSDAQFVNGHRSLRNQIPR